MDASEHLRVVRESMDEDGTSEGLVAALESAGLLCTRAEREFIEATLPFWCGGPVGTARMITASVALKAERASAPATTHEPDPLYDKWEAYKNCGWHVRSAGGIRLAVDGGTVEPQESLAKRLAKALSNLGGERLTEPREVVGTRGACPVVCERDDLNRFAKQDRDELAAAEARIASLESALAEERAKPKEGARKFEIDARTCERVLVHEYVLKWRHENTVSEFTGKHAERHAREHAAKLTAEQGGVA